MDTKTCEGRRDKATEKFLLGVEEVDEVVSEFGRQISFNLHGALNLW